MAAGMDWTHEELRSRLASLDTPPTSLYNGDFLLTWEHVPQTLHFLLGVVEILEGFAALELSTRAFETGLGLSIFRDKSTRTRYAFRSGCNVLGLQTEELEESTSQIAHGETVRETATMISFLTEVIGIRDDMFLGEGHKYMVEVADSLEDSYRARVLRRRPAVINLQCDLDHPTQSLADLSHLGRVFGGLSALRGKRLVMSWAYSPSYGKPLSVPQGIVALMSRFGMDVVLAHPKGYDLVDEPLEAARRFAAESGGSFTVAHSMKDAFEGADIVYPKSWAPSHVMRERTKLLRAGDTAKLAELEQEALAHNARFKDWECDDTLMSCTRGGRALYMHCLPADVTDVSCAAGEVSQEVFERARLDTYREASHKPYVIAALILATRFADPTAVLKRMLDRSSPRLLA